MIGYKLNLETREITEKELEWDGKSVFYIGADGKRKREKIRTQYTQWYFKKEDAIYAITSQIEMTLDNYRNGIEYYEKLLNSVKEKYPK